MTRFGFPRLFIRDCSRRLCYRYVALNCVATLCSTQRYPNVKCFDPTDVRPQRVVVHGVHHGAYPNDSNLERSRCLTLGVLIPSHGCLKTNKGARDRAAALKPPCRCLSRNSDAPFDIHCAPSINSIANSILLISFLCLVLGFVGFRIRAWNWGGVGVGVGEPT